MVLRKFVVEEDVLILGPEEEAHELFDSFLRVLIIIEDDVENVQKYLI